MTKKNTTEVAKSDTQETSDNSVVNAENLLQMAVKNGAEIETLERLMDLRDRVNAENAKQAFNEAMAAFQSECPVIKKSKPVPTRNGKIAYHYAPIESIVSQVKTLLQKHGFHYKTSMEFVKNGDQQTVRATCIVTHELGHSETSDMEVPLGTKTDVMSSSQVVAAAQTFAKRYAFLNAFGIMTGDEDNDAPGEENAEEWMSEVDAITTIDALKAYWEKNRGKGKNFDQYVAKRKKEIQEESGEV